MAVRKSRGKKVLTEILGEGFDGVIVCDGWRVYPSYTDRIQRCWAHLLREAEYLAERHGEAGPLSKALHGLYGGLRRWAVDKPPPDRNLLVCYHANPEAKTLAKKTDIEVIELGEPLLEDVLADYATFKGFLSRRQYDAFLYTCS